jgi:hypothetical protein
MAKGLLHCAPPLRTYIGGGSLWVVLAVACVWFDERAFAAGFPNEPLFLLHAALFTAQTVLGLWVLVFLLLFMGLKVCIEILKFIAWFRGHDAEMRREFSEQTKVGAVGWLAISLIAAVGCVPMLWPAARFLL